MKTHLYHEGGQIIELVEKSKYDALQAELYGLKGELAQCRVEAAQIAADQAELAELKARPALSRLRPIAEAQPIPSNSMRVFVLLKADGYVINPTMATPSHYADILLPAEASQPEPSQAGTAHPRHASRLRLSRHRRPLCRHGVHRHRARRRLLHSRLRAHQTRNKPAHF